MNFIGGRNIKKAFSKIHVLQNNYTFSPLLDFTKEGTKNIKTIDKNIHSIKRDIRSMDLLVNYSKSIPKDFSYSLKLSTFGGQEHKLMELLKQLETHNINSLKSVFLDAENSKSDHENTVYNNVFKENESNKNFKLFKTYQMYKKDTLCKLKHDIHSIPNLNIKLVRGAYLDIKDPRFYNKKEDTDKSYNDALEFVIKNKKHYNYDVMVATHNDFSILKTIKLIERFSIDQTSILFGQLLGFNEKGSKYLSDRGYTVYKYIPYGPYSTMLPYLLRRIYENYPILQHIKS